MGCDGGDEKAVHDGRGGLPEKRVQEVSNGIRNTYITCIRDSQQFTFQELDEIQLMRDTPDFFNKLVNSIAPTVFGHQEIKCAILLLLMSGVHESTSDAIYLRGDINVCIVGDPSSAKSQLLEYTADLLPRSVYTSGKEPETYMEALMLADNGICCIDEFEKMDERDQVAIREAKEKESPKDGIQTTMNPRTSILAAANPTGGHYDKTKHMMHNVALRPSLLSWFDLLYVMIDDPDDQTDYHITHHSHSPTFTTEQLKLYISYAKTLKPKRTPEALRVLGETHASFHRDWRRVAYHMTPMKLQSLDRLSAALARCHLDIEIQPCDVRLAVRLLKTSIIHVESSEIDLSEFQKETNNDSNDNGTGNKQGNKILISGEYFERVTRALVTRLRQHGSTLVHGGTKLAGLRQRDLILWYVGQQKEKNNYLTVTEITIVMAIIESLIRTKGCLIVVDGGRQNVEDGGQNASNPAWMFDRILAVAPNYAPE